MFNSCWSDAVSGNTQRKDTFYKIIPYSFELCMNYYIPFKQNILMSADIKKNTYTNIYYLMWGYSGNRSIR